MGGRFVIALAGSARGGTAFAATTCARVRGEPDGLDDIERTAGRDAIGAEVIPSAQLLDGDAETIGDGYEGVPAAHLVTLTG